MQVDKEAAIMVRDREGTMQLTPQDNHVMSKHRVLSLKPQLRLEWRGQDGQSETEQPDHSASLGDSITSSTRIRFSVRTERFSNGVGKTTSSRTRQFSYAFTLRKASRSTERKGVSPGLESNLPAARLHFNRIFSAASLPRLSTMSKVTLAPSARVLRPARSTAEIWTNTSFVAPSG